jgi:CSLREA domain-containing protein
LYDRFSEEAMTLRRLLLIACAGVSPSVAAAATFTVNTTADLPDTAPGNGVCATSAGSCSLRAAIQEANTTPAPDTIAFNVAGAGVQTFQASLPVIAQPVVIDGFTQPGAQPNTNPSGGLNTILKIEISGGLVLMGGGTTVRGVVAHEIRFLGPVPSQGVNHVEGNFIGTDATGTQDRSMGVGVSFSHLNAPVFVGGFSPKERNLISGNDTAGIDMLCTANIRSCHVGSFITGNLIGTDVSGQAALPNGIGIRLTSSGGVFIGGSHPDQRNVISGNTLSGILAVGGNSTNDGIGLEANRIGADDSGTIAIPNGTGVSFGPACIGDPSCRGPRVSMTGGLDTENLIAHNAGAGIHARGGLFSITGTTIKENGGDGITLETPWVPIDNSVVRLNTITSNGGSGISGSTSVMRIHILDNTISLNDRNGVELRAPVDAAASHAWIEGNSFSGNGLLGIDLGGDGVTPNDPLDQDQGPNDLVNHPVLASACTSGSVVQVNGSVQSEPSSNVRVEFFRSASCDPAGYGEGEARIGSDTAFTDAAGNGPFVTALNAAVTSGTWITATAALTGGFTRTSEFGRCVQVFPSVPPTQTVNGPTSVCAGTPFILFGVTGAEAFQWFRNGSPIPGATGLTYGRTSAALSDAASYTVLATSCGATTMSPAHTLGVVTCNDTPLRLDVDAHAGAGTVSDLNGVLEPGETALIEPRYRNDGILAQALDGTATVTGPTPGTYGLPDASAAYGTVTTGQTTDCFGVTGDCYRAAVGGPRPQTHWDALFEEATTGGDPPRRWSLHLGDTFTDMPRANPFYRFVETIVHDAVTGGCSTSTYCPNAPATREQMAVFVLVAREGPFYSPPACVAGAERFTDVPASSAFCRWVEELARRQVAGGCGGNGYCPSASVSRQQMAVFVLATREAPGYAPPACVAGAERFTDVPASSGFCRWIEELARRGVVGGCANNTYCPGNPVSRGEMSVFLTVTFGLLLYGP